MKHLRHPIRAVREPFGKAGLMVAILALVLAMGGAAFAASGGLSGQQKKEVRQIAKRYAGTGTAGPTGPAGPSGKNGARGAEGVSGENGVGVTTAPASSAECASGGIKVSSATGKSKVCDGTTGFTATLPSGDFDLGEGLWRIPDSKTAAGVRLVEATDFAAAEIRAHVAQKKTDGRLVGGGDPMWVTSTGTRLGAENVRRMLRELVKRTNKKREADGKMLLPHVTPHTLRRTFASMCFWAKRELPWVVFAASWRGRCSVRWWTERRAPRAAIVAATPRPETDFRRRRGAAHPLPPRRGRSSPGVEAGVTTLRDPTVLLAASVPSPPRAPGDASGDRGKSVLIPSYPRLPRH